MKLSWRGVNLLFLVSQAIQSAAEGHATAFTPLLLRDLGLNDAEVAIWALLLVATTTATSLPLGPFWGVLAERFSRKAIVIRSFVVSSIALLVMAWAPELHWLVFARALVGLSFGVGGVIAATQAMLTPRRELGKAIALVQSAMPIAASLGPPLGAAAIPAIGLRGLFLVDAAASFVMLVALALLLPEPTGGPRPPSVLKRTGEVLGLVWAIRPVRWNFIGSLLMRGGTATVDSYLPVRITQLADDPAPAIGLILGVYGALTTFGTWGVGRIVDRINQTRVFAWTMLASAVLAAGLATAPWLWLVGVLAALRSIPLSFTNTVLFAHLARVVPREHQTPILGLIPTPRNVGGLIFPLVAASVAGLAAGAALLVGGATYGLAVLAALKLERITRAHGRPEVPVTRVQVSR